MADHYETLSLIDCKAAKRNFAGEERRMNQKGYRNFLLIIKPETADDLSQRGWPVITLEPKKEGDNIGYALYVNIKFRYDNNGNLESPTIWRTTKSGRTRLTEKTVNKLDKGICTRVDVKVTYAHKDYNPMSGKPSDKVWLEKLVAFMEEDEFDSMYYDLENEDSLGFGPDEDE